MSGRGELRLGSRLVIGAIAGVVGTMAMTRAMRRFHARLPEEERYPLTPREIVDDAADKAGGEKLPDEAARDVTTASHFLYGGMSGAMLGAMQAPVSPVSGAIAGVGVWLASYMGWLPAGGLLKPATRHPLRRNLGMIAAHAVWGWSTAKAMKELALARETIFAAGPEPDRAAPPAVDGEGR
jgi:hypothetical protein